MPLMRLVTYSQPESSERPRPGAEIGNFIVDLQNAAGWAQQNCAMPVYPVPDSILGLIQTGKEASK